jgi:hypothetical protein
VYPIPDDVQALMTTPSPSVTFSFLDPTSALVRLLLCSPLAADLDNMAFYPETDGNVYDDFCNGEKWARVQRALPVGAAALPAVLFFDELHQDEKGFASAEGIILVGGCFRRDARESTHAKLALGVFPPVDFPKARGPVFPKQSQFPSSCSRDVNCHSHPPHPYPLVQLG